MHRIALTVWMLLMAFAAPAAAEHSLTYRNVVVLQANPILARDMLSFDYQRQLYESLSPYLRNNYVGFALRPTISPGFLRLGAAVEVAPASVVRLAGGVEYVNYFGRFGQLQGFESVDAAYSDRALVAAHRAGADYAASGYTAFGSLLLQNRFGPVIFRNAFELYYTSLNLNADDDYFVDPVLDMLMPERGFAFNNDLDVLYISPFGLIVGARYTVTKAFYPGVDDDPNGPTHRVGPTFSYVVFQNPGSAFDSATLFVTMNWWLKHRYRTGQEVSAGFPFLSVGFSFTGNIF